MGIGTRSKSHQGECLGQDQASTRNDRVSLDNHSASITEKGSIKGTTNYNSEGYNQPTAPAPNSNSSATTSNANVGPNTAPATDKRPAKLSKSDQNQTHTQVPDDGSGGQGNETATSVVGPNHNCPTSTTASSSSTPTGTCTESKNGILAFTFTRTRGIKRPKRELRPPGSPVKKVAKEVKTATPEAKKRQWELWTVDEKSTFFQALNECGRDFDAIQNNFAQKYKKKGAPAMMIKNKEQVRHFYYRTWNKISKYIEMKDGIKKHALEVYGLIHYGEMRKRLGGMRADKNLHKLNEFIQEGSTLIKIRRKSFRIRTPFCNALKKINNVEDPVEDDESTCRVPDRVTLELNPKNNSAWFHVQEMAQNPRLRMTLKSDQHLSTVMSFLQKKWKPPRLKLKESLNSFDETQKQLVLYPHRSSKCYPVSLQAIETAPKPDLKLSNYYTNIKAYKAKKMLTISSNNENSCDAALVQSPKLPSENVKDEAIISGSFIKESDGPVAVSGTTEFADVSSDNAMFPDTMMSHNCQAAENSTQSFLNPTENKSLELSLQVSEKNSENRPTVTSCSTSQTTTVTSNSSVVVSNSTDIQACEDLEKIKVKLIEQSQTGWTMKEAENLTVAQLFLIFGKDEPIRLEYDWSKSPDSKDKLYESYTIINRLRRLAHLATMEFTDYVKVKAPKSNEKPKSGKAGNAGCEVCEACGKLLNPPDAKNNSKIVNKSINRNTCFQNNTKNGVICKESSGNSENNIKRSHDKKEQKSEEKTDDSERVDGVFRVPVIPGKGPMPQTLVTNEYINKYRPTRYRRKLLHSAQKPIFFQRTLLPKENPHMMTLTLLPSATPVTVDASFLPVNNRTSAVISNTYTTQVLTQPIVSTLSVHNQNSPVIVQGTVQTSVGLTAAACNTSTAPVSTTAAAATAAAATAAAVVTNTFNTAVTTGLSSSTSLTANTSSLSENLPVEGSTNIKDSSEISNTPQDMPLISTTSAATDTSSTTSTSETKLGSSPPNMSTLFDISLSDVSMSMLEGSETKTPPNDSGLTTPPLNTEFRCLTSPYHSPFKFSSSLDNNWILGEMNDISLGSLLNDSPIKKSSSSDTSPSTTTVVSSTANTNLTLTSLFNDWSRDSSTSRMDLDTTWQMIMNENSMDYVSKFAELAEKVAASDASAATTTQVAAAVVSAGSASSSSTTEEDSITLQQIKALMF
ncbi:Hypothetical predicted protein [Argonauta hians]